MDEVPEPLIMSVPITPARVWLRYAVLGAAAGAFALLTHVRSFLGVLGVWFLVVAIIMRLRAPRSIGFHANGISIESLRGSRFVPWSEIESMGEDVYSHRESATGAQSSSITFKRASPIILGPEDADLIVPRILELKAAHELRIGDRRSL